ncbi:HK97 gp10 family phage protein [Actinomyces urogenitalis]|uniref:HK97 gp10 family phage protein n=1 Tax=Actinomyces urogenitalis TaxID=103621 RepID=UPI001E33A1FB|nr:HK97 gp10 family phage protein [Actinomyces urogenitalis]MDU0864420.1 HK97 gp10 family phage protein [Actinomyces urogenitalis]MDU0874966.1 HK97 gp10 family phage protein [Actinomyces urogenitalis]MDU1565363.1 HK97 gp10 family phage protein [Actinomyces urogenitalis]MDU1640606.1 HK97 gp10 family phage protein [Actinomyces urogenitalis]MDU5874559.1 HK97 gp10 family phage protein [Actinomyces urogenitalis]
MGTAVSGGSWRLPQVAANMTAASTKALALGAEVLRAAAVEQTPVDEGTLRRSASVSIDKDVAAVSYNTPYAVRQHEELGYHHPKGGKAKYLEDALHENSDQIRAVIAEHIRRAGGGR